MKNKYKIVTYGEVYDFLSEYKHKFENNVNFVAFFNAIKRHTFETENEYYFQFHISLPQSQKKEP